MPVPLPRQTCQRGLGVVCQLHSRMIKNQHASLGRKHPNRLVPLTPSSDDPAFVITQVEIRHRCPCSRESALDFSPLNAGWGDVCPFSILDAKSVDSVRRYFILFEVEIAAVPISIRVIAKKLPTGYVDTVLERVCPDCGAGEGGDGFIWPLMLKDGDDGGSFVKGFIEVNSDGPSAYTKQRPLY